MPATSATLSFVPNRATAMSLSDAANWSMNAEPTAVTGETSDPSTAAVSSPAASAVAAATDADRAALPWSRHRRGRGTRWGVRNRWVGVEHEVTVTDSGLNVVRRCAQHSRNVCDRGWTRVGESLRSRRGSQRRCLGSVLVVDDEPIVREVVARYLERDGLRVQEVGDGAEALRWLASNRPSLVVLDVMLPGADGLQILRHLRESGDVPVILLTARAEEIDRVVGLEFGADDYVVKPFSPRELSIRVRNLLRRAAPATPRPTEVLAFGPSHHRSRSA